MQVVEVLCFRGKSRTFHVILLLCSHTADVPGALVSVVILVADVQDCVSVMIGQDFDPYKWGVV